MISLAPGTKVFLACRPVDLRNGFDGLAAKAQQVIGTDPFSGHLFLFRGKRGNYFKGLYWDGSGMWLVAKRLEKGRFVWPPIVDGAMTLTPAQFSILPSAAVSAKRDLRSGGARPPPLDPMRLGWSGGMAPRPNRRRDSTACLCRREDPRRRHDSASAVTWVGTNQDRSAVGSTSATTDLSVGRPRQRRPISTAPTVAVNIRPRTWRASPASSKPTAMPGSKPSTVPVARMLVGSLMMGSLRWLAGRTAVVSSSTCGSREVSNCQGGDRPDCRIL